MNEQTPLDDLGRRAATAVRERADRLASQATFPAMDPVATDADAEPPSRHPAPSWTSRAGLARVAPAALVVTVLAALAAGIIVALPSGPFPDLLIAPQPAPEAGTASEPHTDTAADDEGGDEAGPPAEQPPLEPCAEAASVEDREDGWELEVADGVITAPVTADGRVFLGSNSGLACLFALDARSGELLWTTPGEIAALTVPVVVGDTIIAGFQESLAGFDAASGEERWRRDITPIETPLVVDGRLVTVAWGPVNSYDGNDLHAIDPTTGQDVWVIEGGVWDPLYVRSDDLVVRAGDGLRYVDQEDGRILGEVEVAGDRPVHAPHGDDLLVTDRSPNTTGVVDAHTGELVWESNVPGMGGSAPVVVGDHVVLASDDGNVYAIGLRTGTYEQRIEIGEPSPPAYWGHPDPPVVDGVVIFATRDGLVAVDPIEGAVRWRAGDGATRTAVLETDEELLAVVGSELLAVDPTTGDVLWSASVAGAGRTLASSPHGVHIRAGETQLRTITRELP